MNATVLSLVLATVFAPPAKTSAERSTRIYVRTTPPGASIVLDGKELGTSDGLFLVPPGVRKITLEMDGYDPEGKTLNVKEGWITRVEVRMVKKGAASEAAMLSQAKQQLLEYKDELSEKLKHYGEQHPEIVKLKSHIQTTENRIELLEVQTSTAPHLDSPDAVNEEQSLPIGFRKRMAEVRNSQLQKAKQASDGKPNVSFEDEFEFAVRAGQGKLTDQEKESLKQQNHPLLGQLADPNTSKLIRFFAKLPDEIHEQLKKEGHVKWRFPDLSEQNQKVVRDIIQLNINMAKQQGTSQPGLSLEALQDSQVGFAVVAMEDASQKVVSWFVLFPEFPNPIWVTVVNAKAAGTPPYFQAHLRDLPLLREKPETALPEEARAEFRTIHLPDADTKDTPVVLDLASGEMLKLPKELNDATYFTKLGKGDIGFDSMLFCLRGGKVELLEDGVVKTLDVNRMKDDAKIYQLRNVPCELLVTTADKRQFLVKVLNETDKGGLNLEYREQSAPGEQITPVATDTSPTKEASPDSVSGILEFRVAATKEEAEEFRKTGKGLGWYESLMTDTNGLVTDEQEKRTLLLLWQTPEKSMTVSDNGKNKWRVIQVSVIAEPDKPGRIGVVFDAEGGRQLKKLTAGHVNRHMAMLVDGRVVSCPMIRSAIGPRVEITGNFSKAELNRLATALQAGMEPSRP